MKEYAVILLAAVLCGGVITIITELRGRLLSPVRRRENVEIVALVAAREGAEGLEETVRGLMWLSETGRASMPLLIAVSEPTDEARRRAIRLAEKAGGEVIDSGELSIKLQEVLWTREEQQR